MNDWSATHYCSGGESGWTMYLDQSYASEHRIDGGGGGVGENYRQKEAKARVGNEEEEEEDLSMVSDASSGPPHYLEDNEECFYNNGCSSYAFSASESAIKCKEEKKKKGKQHGRNQQHSYLDDTASSPVYGYGKASKINAASSNEALEENAVDFSQGFSATHFKRNSALRKHFSFYRSEKSAPEE